jgi:hypothetical protein
MSAMAVSLSSPTVVIWLCQERGEQSGAAVGPAHDIDEFLHKDGMGRTPRTAAVSQLPVDFPARHWR